MEVSTATPVQIGLILACGGFLVSAIWWAASLSAKVDTMLQTLNKITDKQTKHDAEILALDKRVTRIEANCSKECDNG